MKKLTYAKEMVIIGNILDENEYGYTVEFEDNSVEKGFKDTVFLEKELTIVEDLETDLVTIEDVRRPGKRYTGKLVYGKVYNYIIFQSAISNNTIEVKKLRKEEGGQTSVYYWDIKKDNLKGSGGLSKKVMDVVKTLI